MRRTLQLTRPLPQYGLMPGDVVVIDPEDPVPVCLLRSLPPGASTLVDALHAVGDAVALDAALPGGAHLTPRTPLEPAPPALQLLR